MLLACHRPDPAPVVTAEDASRPAVIDASEPVDSAPPPDEEDAAATGAFHVAPVKGSWLASIPHEKGFKSLTLSATGKVYLTWIQNKQHKLNKSLPPNEDYPGNYASKLELLVEQGGQLARIDFGDRSGAIRPLDATMCQRRRYRPPVGEDWTYPRFPGLVSAFSVGITQGDSDFVVAWSGTALVVLHRETSDGLCEPMIHQGPIETCKDEAFGVIAEVQLTGDPPFIDSIQATGKPFDCATADPMMGPSLLAPRSP